jgi:hypothetical protein
MFGSFFKYFIPSVDNHFGLGKKSKTSISFDTLKNNYNNTKKIKTTPSLSYGRKNPIDYAEDSDFIQKFIDTSKKEEISRAMSSNLNKGLMKTVKPKHKVFAETEKIKKMNASMLLFKEKDVVEWNKYAAPNSKQIKDYDPNTFSSSDFTFQDEDLYKIYVDLCSNRDAIPPLDENKINNLKKSDPVFNKRYSTWFLSATLNKPPKFEIKDYKISHFVPKYALEKTKKDIISRNFANNDMRNLYRSQVASALARSKEFLDTISSFN